MPQPVPKHLEINNYTQGDVTDDPLVTPQLLSRFPGFGKIRKCSIILVHVPSVLSKKNKKNAKTTVRNGSGAGSRVSSAGILRPVLHRTTGN